DHQLGAVGRGDGAPLALGRLGERRAVEAALVADGQRRGHRGRADQDGGAGPHGYLMSGSRGRPRIRSPIWLRLISLVPPAIDMPRCMRSMRLLRPATPSMKGASGPCSLVAMATHSWPISET